MFDGCSDWNLCGQKAHTPLNKVLMAIRRFPNALWKTSVLLDFCLLSIFPVLFSPGFIITDVWRENKFCFCSPKLSPGGVKSVPPSSHPQVSFPGRSFGRGGCKGKGDWAPMGIQSWLQNQGQFVSSP